MEASRSIWDIGRLPFHVGALPVPRDDRFPGHLPFRVGLRESVGLMTQVHDEATMEVLREVYDRGSQLGIPMSDRGLGKAYAVDFQGVIERWMGDSMDGATLLEIGSGSGHLLGALAAAGANATGVEPDPRCREVMQERGIPVVTSTFEEFRAESPFDCIVHYCVLEHAADPLTFLQQQRELLAPGGRIVCAVPDCGAALEDGDISILVHQHWSYFSAASLRSLAAAAGLRVEHHTLAEVGGLLYASLVAADEDSGGNVDPGPGTAEAERFVSRARSAVSVIGDYVDDLHARGVSLGIYCPTRAFNYVPDDAEAWQGVRLFDDAPALLGQYVPPFALPVESGDALASRPVDEVLIMSRAFGAAIEDAIRARGIEPSPRVRHIGELLADE